MRERMNAGGEELEFQRKHALDIKWIIEQKWTLCWHRKIEILFIIRLPLLYFANCDEIFRPFVGNKTPGCQVIWESGLWLDSI